MGIYLDFNMHLSLSLTLVILFFVVCLSSGYPLPCLGVDYSGDIQRYDNRLQSLESVPCNSGLLSPANAENGYDLWCLTPLLLSAAGSYVQGYGSFIRLALVGCAFSKTVAYPVNKTNGLLSLEVDLKPQGPLSVSVDNKPLPIKVFGLPGLKELSIGVGALSAIAVVVVYGGYRVIKLTCDRVSIRYQPLTN